MSRFRVADSGFDLRDADHSSRTSGQGHMRPAPAGGMPFAPQNCQGTTKAGTACKAKPALGSSLCVGHLRSAGEVWKHAE